MKSQNIVKSILSISSPGAYLVENYDSLARQTARECNDFAAELKRRRPTKFGFWAVLPLPDVDGSLIEMRRALDQLDADGVGLETNAHGHYLGDPAFEPIFAELNGRRATVFIHPTAPCMLTSVGSLAASPLGEQYARPIFEFFFDTARAITNLFLTKTIERYPDITYIVPHVGGAWPPCIPRICNLPKMIGMEGIDLGDVKKQIKDQFYFDLAGFGLPEQLQGLLPYVTFRHILYGSDFPYTPLQNVVEVTQVIADELPKFFPEEVEQKAIYHDNAAHLLARRSTITDGSQLANGHEGSRHHHHSKQ